MSVASQAIDPRTVQRLRGRRIVVVDADASRARGFADALQQHGAVVATVDPSSRDYEAAHAIDADVLLVNEDEPEPCRALVLALRQHPRTRWSTVLPVSFAALRPGEVDQPDVMTIADQVTGFATPLVELNVRARGKLPYETVLEPLGPSRTLRALAGTGRNMRVTFSDGRMRAELELAEGHVGGVLAWIDGSETPLSDAEALSSVLAMASGQLLIEEPREPALWTWRLELSGALAIAAARAQERGVHATVPQLSFAEILAEARAKGREPNGLQAALELEPLQPVTPDSEPADIATRVTYEPAMIEGQPRRIKPARTRAQTRVVAMAFALLGTSALAFALHTRGGGLDAGSYSGSLATAAAQPSQLAPAPLPTASAAEPDEVTVQEAAAAPVRAAPPAAPPPREPSRSELEQAKRIVKRANHYLRAKRYGTAAAAYEKALALAPSHVHAMRSLIRVHLHERNVEEALRWAEQLAVLEPADSVSRRLLDDARALRDERQGKSGDK